jgi:hypothetical protein
MSHNIGQFTDEEAADKYIFQSYQNVNENTNLISSSKTELTIKVELFLFIADET